MMVLLPRIELRIRPYQGRVIPLNYRSIGTLGWNRTTVPTFVASYSNPLNYKGQMVAGPGVEPGTRAYETREIPFLYPAIFGGNGKNRTYTLQRMKLLHYRYATLPYINTL